jgi:hypothetical protein
LDAVIHIDFVVTVLRVSEEKAQFVASVDEEAGSDRATVCSQASGSEFGSRSLKIPGSRRGASKYQKSHVGRSSSR